MSTEYAGIDYGLGKSNINKETGIRFGVISQNSVGNAWHEDAEADYGPPHCPKCGNQASKPEEFGETFANGRPDDYTHETYDSDDFVCVDCKHFFGPENAFGDEPVGFYYDDQGYKLGDCLDNDIIVILSPYYTYAQFCSPCVPGACNLDSPLTDPMPNNKCYCLGHEWFEESKAPYPVYSVETNWLVEPKE